MTRAWGLLAMTVTKPRTMRKRRMDNVASISRTAESCRAIDSTSASCQRSSAASHDWLHAVAGIAIALFVIGYAIWVGI